MKISRKPDLAVVNLVRASVVAIIIAAMIVPPQASFGTDSADSVTEIAGLTQTQYIKTRFTENPRCPVYDYGRSPVLQISLDYPRPEAGQLSWQIRDYLGQQRDQGTITIPAGDQVWTTDFSVQDYGAGYFEIHLKTDRNVTVPAAGTRPSGYVAYGILPQIEALPLEYPDASRFGAQGTNFIQADRNPYLPVYPFIGAKWAYYNRRLGQLAPNSFDDYHSVTDPEQMRKNRNWEAQSEITSLLDLHGLPDWLLDIPEGHNLGTSVLTKKGQRFRPNDYQVYKQLVAKVVKENVLRRQILFPKMQHSYYQIHWEPDWHWKGEDEDFILMYRYAMEAIRENDPQGLLLGPNYGVLKTGNRLLARLLPLGLADYLDGIVFHTYYLTGGAAGRQSLVDDMRELVALKNQYLGTDAKLINTEWGCGWRQPPNIDPNALRTELATFMRGHLITLGEGADATWYFYTADHGANGHGLFYNLVYPQTPFGSGDLEPKPVGMAAATASRLLEGSKTLGAIEYLDKQILGYAFDRSGEMVVCLWSKDDVQRQVKIPVGCEQLQILDPLGNSQTVVTEAGVLTVTTGAMPIWLRGAAAKSMPFGREQLLAYAGDQLSLDKSFPDGQVCVFSAGQWKQIGSSDEFTLLSDSPEGEMLLGIFTAKTDLSATFLLKVQPNLLLTEMPLTIPGYLRFKLENPRQQTVSGSVVLSAADKQIAVKKVSLAEQSSEIIEFPVRDLAGGIETRLTFVDDQGASCQITNLPLKKIHPATLTVTPPVIDGDLSDWQLELFHSWNDEKKPELSAKMNVRLAVQYNADNLYIAVKSHDKQHVQTKHPTGLWFADSLQIGLATGLNADKSWQFWQKLVFGMNSKNNHLNCYRDMGTAFSPSIIKQNEISWQFKHAGDESCYEVAIPWSQIAPDLTAPPAGFLGLGILVNNVDYVDAGSTKESPREYIDILGGMHWSKPEDFAILMLE